MRRTQLYLDDDLWSALHDQANREGTSVSELVRQAARERFMPDPHMRQIALAGIVGIWKNRSELPDTETYVRGLRKGKRMERLGIR